MSAAEPLFPAQSFEALRAHPSFRQAVRAHAATNLAAYAAATVHERWLISDLGRASLSGAALILDAMPGGLTRNALYAGAATNRICSRGRVSAYISGCLQQGFFEASVSEGGGQDGGLRLTPRFLAPMVGALANFLGAVATLDPDVEPARRRLADQDDEAFRRRFLGWLGLLSATRPDLYNGPDKPIMLFLGRDGGSRVLECFLTSQPGPAGRRLLAEAPLSRSALARASATSRTHVTRLVADGVAQRLMTEAGGRIVFSKALNDDVERHYTNVFELMRVTARKAIEIQG